MAGLPIDAVFVSATGAIMGTEIERKFLLATDTWKDRVERQADYAQGYLANNERCSVRVRVSGDRAWINIKSMTLGVRRSEYEFLIPAGEARQLLHELCEQPVIEKTRYFVSSSGHTWEIDEFRGANAGLTVAEIELQQEDESFVRPDWLGAEVSHDPRYYNVNLASHPYREWRDR